MCRYSFEWCDAPCYNRHMHTIHLELDREQAAIFIVLLRDALDDERKRIKETQERNRAYRESLEGLLTMIAKKVEPV